MTRLIKLLLSKFKALIAGQSNPGLKSESARVRERDARSRLQALREQELSVGADFRRGQPPSKAPGQAHGGQHSIARKGQAGARAAAVGRAVRSSDVDDVPRKGADDGDFASSAAIAGVTHSTSMGYILGGSMAGAAIGSAIAEAASSSCSVSANEDAPSGFSNSCSSSD